MNTLLGLLYKPNPGSEIDWQPFVKQHLQHTFHVLAESHRNSFFPLVQYTFGLLHDLQFTCLTSHDRSCGIHLFMTSQQKKNREEMEERYQQWTEKEKQYLRDAGYGLENLSQDQKNALQAARKVFFQLVHEEQKSLKESDPFLPFSSVWNAKGEKNADFALRWSTHQMKKFKNSQMKGKNKAFIDKVDLFFKAHLGEKKRYEALTQEQQLLADAAKESALKALLQTLYSDPETLLHDHTHIYDTALSYDRSETRFFWENLEKLKIDAQASLMLQERWTKCVQRENELLQPVYFMGDFQKLVKDIRSIIFKIIDEEQQELSRDFPSLPFVSIYDQDGNLNLDFWIDHLDAKAKRNGERLPDKVHLKDCCDYDIMRILHSPVEEANTVGPTGKRNGLITPDFCHEILETMKEFYDLQKKKLGLRATTDDLEQLQAVFQDSKLSREEQILCFQNEFCDVLSTLHYLQGDSAIVLQRLNISFVQSISRFSSLTHDHAMDFFSNMEKECQTILKEVETATRLSRPQNKLAEHTDLIITKIRNYSDLLDMMGDQMERLGTILNYFSKTRPMDSSTKFKSSSEVCLRIQKIYKDIASIMKKELQIIDA